MKIERINENQIRCTLSSDDLSERQINLGELAYGTEKARRLFHEMIDQASQDFGFQAEDIPLMVEAIPLSSDSIMLIITKIEDPEELDTRFSKFSPPADEDLEDLLPASLADQLLEGADVSVSDEKQEISDGPSNTPNALRVFTFPAFDEITHAASVLVPSPDIHSRLYLDRRRQKYYLVIFSSSADPADDTSAKFGRLCNTLSEFGRRVTVNQASIAYYDEHFDTIIRQDALSVLASLA